MLAPVNLLNSVNIIRFATGLQEYKYLTTTHYATVASYYRLTYNVASDRPLISVDVGSKTAKTSWKSVVYCKNIIFADDKTRSVKNTKVRIDHR